MKQKRSILIAVLIVLILLAFTVISFFAGKVSMNPAGTVGNTAGNLNNSGLFCEYDGIVYFSNAADNGRLYSMNPDESGISKLSDLHVRNILSGGKYLYYFQLGDTGDSAGIGNIVSSKSFNRCNLKGKDVTCLTRDVVLQGQLVDNYLYLMTSSSSALSFYKMKIDRSETVALANYEINPACAANGVIYYNGTQDNHYLYSLDTATDIAGEIWRGNLWYPIVEGDYVYYMDVENNYRLCRYSFSQNLIEVLTSNRVDCYNIGSGYIYYQKNGATPQLKCMRADGTDQKVIAEGNYTNINMTSQYVYFQEFGKDSSLYHSYLGTDSYSEFFMQ